MSQLPNNINPLKASLNTGKAHKASKPAKRNIDLGKHLSKLDPRKIPFGALKRVPRGYRIASLLTVAVALSLPVANKHLDLDSHTPAPSTAAPAEAPAKISEEKKVSAKPENKPQEESDINAQIEALKAQLAQQQEETLKLQSLLKEQQTGTNEQKTPENMTVDEAAAYGMNNIENVAQELENQGIDTSALQGMREMMANGNPLETNSNIINNAKNFNQQFVERAQGKIG